MPLPRNLNSKGAFNKRYVEPYGLRDTYELVKDALRDLSPNSDYIPFNYNIPDQIYYSPDENKMYAFLNNCYKKDKNLSTYLSEFTRGKEDAPLFTDKNSHHTFIKQFYDFLCEKIWGVLATKYLNSPDFKTAYDHLDENDNILYREEDEKKASETMDAISTLISVKHLTLPAGVKIEDVKEIIESLQRNANTEHYINRFPSETRARHYVSNRENFITNLRTLDKILAPNLLEGENAPFDNSYYSSIQYYHSEITDILTDRLNSIQTFSKDAPEKSNVGKMMAARYVLPGSILDSRTEALTKLIACRKELDKSDHFFQTSSQQFKDMKDALDAAIREIRATKKASLTEYANSYDPKKVRETIRTQLENVSEKTHAYLVYKEDGPTGLFGASRVAAAKGIRDAIRSMGESIKDSKILKDSKNNIKDFFVGEQINEPEEKGLNLSEASRAIAGYIAPCSGTNLEPYKAFYAFDEEFEKDYSIANGNRIDLVLDYLKHPDEAGALKKRINVTKNNYKPIADAKSEDFLNTKKDLGYRYVGASYAIKGLIDKIMVKKAPDVDVVLLGELTQVINLDMKELKGIKFDKSFGSKITENTKYVKAVVQTAAFIKKAMGLEEKGIEIASLSTTEMKNKYTNQERTDLRKTPTSEVELNVMLGYSLLKSIAAMGGMKSVLNSVTAWQANDPNWTWEKMAVNLREYNGKINGKIANSFNTFLNDEQKEERIEVEKDGKKEFIIKSGSGHIMRHYDKVMKEFGILCNEKIQKAISEKEKKVQEKENIKKDVKVPNL